VLREKGFGCELICPLSSEYFRFVSYAFVDDTNLIQSQLVEHPEQARINLQQAIDTWEASLKATCGAIVPEKTVWWLVSFKWSGTTWEYASIHDCPGELLVNDISNQRKIITRIDACEAYETLGVFLAPDGNNEQQFKKMLSAATKWADGLRTGTISKNDVWIALQSTILRTLAYPLAALRLSKSQCEAILAPILRYCLPAMGVCRNFSRRLVYATVDYMGLNIYHLYTLQEISRLKDIILHTFSDTLTGKLYRTSLELFYIELGLSPTGYWDISTADLLTTPSLIKVTMVFLKQHNIVLKHNLTVPLLRDNDIFIMDALLQLELSPQELRSCNHCRIFLKVSRLSEITTGNGDSISEEAWLGQITLPKHSDNTWPIYPKPPHSTWTIWQKCISRAFIRRGRKVRTFLGKWIVWDTNWQWYTTKDGSLYSLSEGLWYCHAPILKRNCLPTYEVEPCSCVPPRNPQRATVYKKGNRLICTGSADFSSISLPIPISFYDYLTTKTLIRWCLDSLHMNEDGLALATAITDGLSANIMAISDGSFKDGFGTAAWTIGT